MYQTEFGCANFKSHFKRGHPLFGQELKYLKSTRLSCKCGTRDVSPYYNVQLFQWQRIPRNIPTCLLRFAASKLSNFQLLSFFLKQSSNYFSNVVKRNNYAIAILDKNPKAKFVFSLKIFSFGFFWPY